MASRKRRNIPYEEGIGGLIQPKRDVSAPNICSLPIEGMSPAFDPTRALLRRAFFLNEDCNNYVSVAFYPQRGYTALVEFGAGKAAPLRLTEQHFTTVTEHLPRLIEALYADDCYTSGVYDSFWITTRGSYKTACMHLGLGEHAKTFVLKLSGLQYLNYIMYIVANQLARYSGAVVDVMSYSLSAMASSGFIEPQPHYSKQIQYPQLYEKLKALILI
jgi:hypothetical protein